MFYETAREALERFSRTADHRFFRIRAHTDRPDLLGTDETSPTSIDVRAVPYSAPPHRAADTHLQATAFHRQFARAIGAPALNSVRRCFVFGFDVSPSVCFLPVVSYFGFEDQNDLNSCRLFSQTLDSVF